MLKKETWYFVGFFLESLLCIIGRVYTREKGNMKLPLSLEIDRALNAFRMHAAFSMNSLTKMFSLYHQLFQTFLLGTCIIKITTATKARCMS